MPLCCSSPFLRYKLLNAEQVCATLTNRVFLIQGLRLIVEISLSISSLTYCTSPPHVCALASPSPLSYQFHKFFLPFFFPIYHHKIQQSSYKIPYSLLSVNISKILHLTSFLRLPQVTLYQVDVSIQPIPNRMKAHGAERYVHCPLYFIMGHIIKEIRERCKAYNHLYFTP
jgi:hypothetical protein